MGDSSQVQVDVWLWPLDVTPDEFGEPSAVLAADETARAERFFHMRDRRRWTVARGRMRQILGQVTGLPPTAVAFSTEPHGRPHLTGAAQSPSFNLSHSGGFAALAVSFDARVGMDIEAIRPMTEAEMAWPLSTAERAAMEGLQGPVLFDAFFRFWTLKEAFIKAVGTGLSLPLDDFDISPPDDKPRLTRLASAPGEIGRWRFAEGRRPTGYRAAVAALTDGRDLRVRWHGSCLEGGL